MDSSDKLCFDEVIEKLSTIKILAESSGIETVNVVVSFEGSHPCTINYLSEDGYKSDIIQPGGATSFDAIKGSFGITVCIDGFLSINSGEAYSISGETTFGGGWEGILSPSGGRFSTYDNHLFLFQGNCVLSGTGN